MSEVEQVYLENKINPTGQVLFLNYGEYANSEGKPK
jgi:hypothetical protein